MKRIVLFSIDCCASTGRAAVAYLAIAIILSCGTAIPSMAQTPKPKPKPKPAVAKPKAAPAASPLKTTTILIPGSTVKIELASIPAGVVSVKNGTGASVKVDVKPFLMAKTETAWEAFDTFLSSGLPSPSYDRTVFPPDAIARPSKTYIPPDMGWGHNGFPTICVSAENVTMFCRWLSQKTGRKFRLPTEAEWQYACMAGSVKLPTAAEVAKCAWTAESSGRKSHPVGKKRPNAWGLYDMLGNAGEWAIDLKGKPVLCGGTFVDKAAKVSPLARAYQTPAWQETDPQFPKSRWWLADGFFCGFRLVCEK